MCALGSQLGLLGCKKKPKEDPLPAPPPQGAASRYELTTAIGQARGLSSALAPTSTRWKRAFVLDDRRVILIGEVVNETIGLVTDNAGRTWRALRMERDGWSAWSVGADGAMALLLGARAAPAPTKDPRAQPQAAAQPPDLMKISFAAFDAAELSAPAPITLEKRAPTAKHPVDVLAAVLSAERAAMVLEEAPRRPVLLYSAVSGSDASPPLKLPPAEQVLPTPYGRPPMLLSWRGRDLFMRPVPDLGKPLGPPQKVPGMVMNPAVAAQMSAPPACEIEGWSIQVLTQQPKGVVVAISPQKNSTFTLPAKVAQKGVPGCGAGRIAVEIDDPKPPDPSDPTANAKIKTTTLAVCALEAPASATPRPTPADGACEVPVKPPFRPWREPHEQWMVATPTKQGAVAVLTSRASARWGLYLAQSVDGGKVYEVPRVIGEGTSDRGRIEVGALVSLGDRILMILETDVTGTSRRGWYVTASDDGGLTWNAP